MPFLPDLNTRGGVLIWGGIITAIPLPVYLLLDSAGFDSAIFGPPIAVSYIVLLCVGWVASYLYRVANKGMTYAKQLRDYEDTVIENRLENLRVCHSHARLSSCCALFA
jgi:hypothetical protein